MLKHVLFWIQGSKLNLVVKKNQGKPRIISWTKLIELGTKWRMLIFKTTNFFILAKKNINNFIYVLYMSVGSKLIMWLESIWTNLRCPEAWRIHVKFGSNWRCGFTGSGTFRPISISSDRRFAPRTFRLWSFRPCWMFRPLTFRPQYC